MDRFIYIHKKRIDLKNSDRLIIQTGSCAAYMKDIKAVSYINGAETKMTVVENENTSLLFVYKNAEPEFDREYNFCIDLPKQVDSVRVVFDKKSYPSGHEEIVLSRSQIERLRKTLDFSLVGISRTKGRIVATGFAESSQPPEFTVSDGKKQLECQVENFCRNDISARYPKEEITAACGFSLSVSDTGMKKLKIAAYCEGRSTTAVIRIKQDKNQDKNQAKKQETDRLAVNNNAFFAVRALRYITAYGMKRFVVKLYKKFFKSAKKKYRKYFAAVNPDEKRRKEQRNYNFAKRPLFSLLIPVYRPQERFFVSMLDSVAAQTYDNWQLCLADGGGEGYTMEEAVRPFVERYGKDKVTYVCLPENLGLAGNTNAAMELAGGDYFVFCDHDDELHPSALFECARCLEKYPETDFIYTDEDKIIEGTNRHVQAHFKSDLNMELLRRNNYICHLVAVKKTLAEKVGKLESIYDGAQDHDYVLRCVEQAEGVRHIPKVLYHWRINKNSTAKAPSTKNYANEAGKRAVAAHLERIGAAGSVGDGIAPGCYTVRYEQNEEPLISVIIPNKDHIEDLKKCIDSLEKISTYRNVEYIVVENNSTQAETFKGYDELQAALAGKIKIIVWEGVFNYSAINNFGVRHAGGEYILLLNNDTAVSEPEALRRMLSHFNKRNVGIVGAKLLYGDGTVQHAGVVLNYQGVAGHAFKGLGDAENGYFGRARMAQEVSAVTAACLLTRKDIYKRAGRFDEKFEVAFNDIDFCMKVRQQGYVIIYEPDAKFYHYESKSRGIEDTAIKQERFSGEIMRFIGKWRNELKAGDPYYNANLDLIGTLYEVKDL